MLINNLKNINKLKCTNSYNYYYYYKNITRLLTQGCLNLEGQELTNKVKHTIESHWRQHFPTKYFNDDDGQKSLPKFYVLSMFPYPSGNLHMGHVRVYTISDTMARFYRMTGHNVLHPMGWDAFGLPAENAAIQHNIPAAQWTNDNITKMKSQLINLGCSFDWDREIATCNENYYKWTQVLFLKLYNDGLAYQKEALVNWDPIDKTVLADEQVDENGCSWRSGALVEKRLLKQWFVKTTQFAKQLYDGLDDPQLQDWKDIINLQKHWIGECTGYSFELPIVYSNNVELQQNEPRLNSITIWTEYPERLLTAEFIILNSQHILNRTNQAIENGIQTNFKIKNPFNKQQLLPVIVCDDYEFPIGQEVQIGCPTILDTDKILAKKYNLNVSTTESESVEFNNQTVEQTKQEYVLNLGKQLGITGGYAVSSKLRDWLISRQRHWGTPIPIVHCPNCGTVPVPENELPVILPKLKNNPQQSVIRKCPKCLNENAARETDTMDTFVDSSWYFLRYLDSQNNEMMFDEKLADYLMPVDLYIGGKEHAVLHLYYARFINHFLHSKRLLPQSEPFKRLLVQGMVMGRSYKLKDTGRYLMESDVETINIKKKNNNNNKYIERSTKKEVIMQWEKMSKSKFNGIDPMDIINEYGIDATRLIILADVAPTSHRNWSSATFPGILKWQKRLWLTINDFHNIRNDPAISEDAIRTEAFKEQDFKLYDARNYYIKGTTFNYRHSHQLSVAISKMQGLTNSLRRTPKEVIKYGKEYERTLATQIIMLAPMAPHFASELWSHFIAINRNRVCSPTDKRNESFNLNENVLEQKWPEVDQEYELDLEIKLNGIDISYIKYPRYKLDKLTFEEAMRAAMDNDTVKLKIGNGRIDRSTYVLYHGCEARLALFKELSSSVNSITRTTINEQQNC